MTKAILHIGAPKTGSSFLQVWLRTNEQTLREQGINFLGLNPSHRVAVENIQSNIAGRWDIHGIINAHSYDSAMGRMDPKCTNVLGSEYFFHANIPALAAKLEGVVDIETIVCFLRRQDVLMASGYAQSVKSGTQTAKPPSRVSYQPHFDWGLMLENWANAFPSARLAVFDYDAVKGDLLTAFRSTLPPVSGTVDDIPRVNESINAEMVEIARILNERSITFTAKQLIEIQKPGSPFAFNEPLTTMLESVYRAVNASLASKFPDRFQTFADEKWKPRGIDLTGQVPEWRVEEVLGALREAA